MIQVISEGLSDKKVAEPVFAYYPTLLLLFKVNLVVNIERNGCTAMADGAWVRRIAVSRKYVVAFSGSGIFSGCRGGFLSGLCIVFLI